MSFTQIEIESFRRFLLKNNLESENAVKYIFEQLIKDSKDNGYTSEEILIDLGNPTIESLLQGEHKVIDVVTKRNLSELIDHFFKFRYMYTQEKLSPEDYEKLSFENLVNIPKNVIWDQTSTAYVLVHNKYSYELFYTKKLFGLVAGILTRVHANMIFEISPKHFFDIRPFEQLENDIPIFVDFILNILKHDLELSKETTSNQLIQTNPELSLLYEPIMFGIKDFVVRHEYSHILMRHVDQFINYKSELEADNLAINSLLDSATYHNSIVSKNSDVLVYQAIGPIMLFFFETTINMVKNNNLMPQKHPHPFSRLKLLHFINRVKFMDHENSNIYYKDIFKMFMVIYSKVWLELGYDYKTLVNGFGIEEHKFCVFNWNMSPFFITLDEKNKSLFENLFDHFKM